MPTKNKLVFELTKMAVKPEYRNKGIGKKLLKKCIDYSKLIAIVQLYFTRIKN